MNSLGLPPWNPIFIQSFLIKPEQNQGGMKSSSLLGLETRQSRISLECSDGTAERAPQSPTEIHGRITEGYDKPLPLFEMVWNGLPSATVSQLGERDHS